MTCKIYLSAGREDGIFVICYDQGGAIIYNDRIVMGNAVKQLQDASKKDITPAMTLRLYPFSRSEDGQAVVFANQDGVMILKQGIDIGNFVEQKLEVLQKPEIPELPARFFSGGSIVPLGFCVLGCSFCVIMIKQYLRYTGESSRSRR